MINLKLKTIASLIDKQDIVLDTCSDHAYLAIYLKKNKLCREVYASDINANALRGARKNIDDADLLITTYLSDGFQNIDNSNINTAVIAGVGANTVLDIMKYAPANIKKYIISSNNHQEYLRKTLYQNHFYIEKEIVIYEKHKYYVIMLVTRNMQQEDYLSLKYGKSNNKDYFNYLIKKEEDILQHLPKENTIEKEEHQKIIKELKEVIKRI